MTTVFEPESWATAGNHVDQATQDMYTGAYSVITAGRYTTKTGTPIGAAISTGESAIYDAWHAHIGYAKEALTSISSKMVSTGEDYATVEDMNTQASSRFW